LRSNGKITRTRLVALGCAVVLAAAAVLVAVLVPGSASVKAESAVRPLAEAPVPEVFKNGIIASARTAGAPSEGLVEVAAVGEQDARAGLVLGHSSAGDVVSLFTPFNFTSFRSPRELLRDRPLAAFASIQPDPSGDTGHVQLSGLATPSVAKATLDLADGSTIDVELVQAGKSGFTFFTYSTDRKATFPQLIHAFGAGGREIYSYDLRSDIAPPVMS
jgi:hypothetical protein